MIDMVLSNILIASAQQGNIADIIGQAESPLAKIRGRFRYQMLIKGQDTNVLHQIVQEITQKHSNRAVKITVDVDPENFM
jgi:primosomal protein N' (replication factor Y)